MLLLPVGASDDGAHSQNEKLDIRNYIEGVSINYSAQNVFEITIIYNIFIYFIHLQTKLLGSYLYEVGQL